MEREIEGLGEPEFHPFLSSVQNEVSLKLNYLVLSKANGTLLIPPLNGDKWFSKLLIAHGHF